MDEYTKREMALRIAYLDPKRFPDVQRKLKKERRKKLKNLPKTLPADTIQALKKVYDKVKNTIPDLGVKIKEVLDIASS